MTDLASSAENQVSGRALVVDPQLLVHAFLFPRGDSAKLLALCAYGRVCAASLLGPDDLPREARYGARGRSLPELRSDARQRRGLIEAALPPGAPTDLLLVASTWQTRQLALYAQSLRDQAPHLSPDVVVRQVNAHAAVWAGETDLADREGQTTVEHLVHIAARIDAAYIISNDVRSDLREGPAAGPRMTTLADFARQLVALEFEFDDINPRSVLRAAVERLETNGEPTTSTGTGSWPVR